MSNYKELAQNKKLVEEYCAAFYNDKDFTRAAPMLAENFVNHHRGVGVGRDRTVSTFRRDIAERFPRFSLAITKMVAEDDFVWTYGLISLDGETPSAISVDIWRVAGRQIVGHWDIGTPITEETTPEEFLTTDA